MHRHRVRAAAASLAVSLTLCVSACASTGSHKLTCDATAVSPGTQPGKPSAKAALDWFLANAKTSVPTTGYSLESHSASRAVYSQKGYKISVTSLPLSKAHPKKVWFVLLTYACA